MYRVCLVALCMCVRVQPRVPLTDELQFLSVIKSNLRRNNDDYKNDVSTPPQNKTLPTYTRPNNTLNRRLNLLSEEHLLKELETNLVSTNNTDRITPITETTINHYMTTLRTFSSKSKIEKFQKYFEKNKHLFKEFLSSRIAARSDNPLRLRASGKGGRQGEESRVPAPDLDRLDPDRLDMSPAVGARVHYRRIRGRLCHRHVLMPEGPKYDSGGRAYLPPHEARRPYPATRRPRLLLPRCCNCCKKSVLGCE